MENPGIVVVGSLNPEKEIQDRVRVLGIDGICQALRATDYKDPPKILERFTRMFPRISSAGYIRLQDVSRHPHTI